MSKGGTGTWFVLGRAGWHCIAPDSLRSRQTVLDNFSNIAPKFSHLPPLNFVRRHPRRRCYLSSHIYFSECNAPICARHPVNEDTSLLLVPIYIPATCRKNTLLFIQQFRPWIALIPRAHWSCVVTYQQQEWVGSGEATLHGGRLTFTEWGVMMCILDLHHFKHPLGFACT